MFQNLLWKHVKQNIILNSSFILNSRKHWCEGFKSNTKNSIQDNFKCMCYSIYVKESDSDYVSHSIMCLHEVYYMYQCKTNFGFSISAIILLCNGLTYRNTDGCIDWQKTIYLPPLKRGIFCFFTCNQAVDKPQQHLWLWNDHHILFPMYSYNKSQDVLLHDYFHQLIVDHL